MYSQAQCRNTHIVNISVVNKVPEMLVVNIVNSSRLEEFREPESVDGMVHGVNTHESLHVSVTRFRWPCRVGMPRQHNVSSSPEQHHTWVDC
jgi:hypothetical protein